MAVQRRGEPDMWLPVRGEYTTLLDGALQDRSNSSLCLYWGMLLFGLLLVPGLVVMVGIIAWQALFAHQREPWRVQRDRLRRERNAGNASDRADG